MFTGIITGVGHIQNIANLGATASHGKRITIACPKGYLDDAGLGDSIALNGACMTVTTLDTSNDAKEYPAHPGGRNENAQPRTVRR